MSQVKRINLCGSKDDPFQRYTMEEPQLVYEGRHTGVKTIITNIANIASDLEIPIICLYFN